MNFINPESEQIADRLAAMFLSSTGHQLTFTHATQDELAFQVVGEEVYSVISETADGFKLTTRNVSGVIHTDIVDVPEVISLLREYFTAVHQLA